MQNFPDLDLANSEDIRHLSLKCTLKWLDGIPGELPQSVPRSDHGVFGANKYEKEFSIFTTFADSSGMAWGIN
jgi:hypothetical protein